MHTVFRGGPGKPPRVAPARGRALNSGFRLWPMVARGFPGRPFSVSLRAPGGFSSTWRFAARIS